MVKRHEWSTKFKRLRQLTVDLEEPINITFMGSYVYLIHYVLLEIFVAYGIL